MTALPPVLMVDELIRDHLARPITVTTFGRDGKPRDDTRVEISARGQEMLRVNQAARAAYFIEHPDESRALSIAAMRGANR